MFNPARLLNSKIGQMFISILLGLGLATLFRKVCNDKNCIRFNGPVMEEVNGKTYQFSDTCYKYELEPALCDPLKREVEVHDSMAKSIR